MNSESKQYYIVIGVSIAFFLFGIALVLNLFPDNWIAYVVCVFVCIGLSILTYLYVKEVIEPVVFTQKGIIISFLIFILLFLLIFEILLLFFPGDLIAFLIAGGIWIVISLIITYISIKELEPMEDTSKAEIFIAIFIIIIGLLIIWNYFLDNLIGIILAGALCILIYLFVFLSIQFYKDKQ